MPDDLVLPVLAAVALLWCLVCSLRQLRTETPDQPKVIWREANADGWSDWIELWGVSPSVGYATVLDMVRLQAHVEATAVQFATMVQPCAAPEFTLRVLFVSDVCGPARDRDLVAAGRGAC